MDKSATCSAITIIQTSEAEINQMGTDDLVMDSHNIYKSISTQSTQIIPFGFQTAHDFFNVGFWQSKFTASDLPNVQSVVMYSSCFLCVWSSMAMCKDHSLLHDNVNLQGGHKIMKCHHELKCEYFQSHKLLSLTVCAWTCISCAHRPKITNKATSMLSALVPKEFYFSSQESLSQPLY